MFVPQQSCRSQSIQPLRTRIWLLLVIFIWVVAVSISWRMILEYEFKGEPPNSEATNAPWPAETSLTIAPDRPTVLFFIHPKCPCTRASLCELERLWVLRDKATNHSPQLIVVATVPPKASADWLISGTVVRASRLSGATLTIDPGGHEARRFGASTSGTVVWFDAEGRRIYTGGITAGRGHEGNNCGRTCLERLLRGGKEPAISIPAFGCRLCLPEVGNSAPN